MDVTWDLRRHVRENLAKEKDRQTEGQENERALCGSIRGCCPTSLAVPLSPPICGKADDTNMVIQS